MKIEKLNENQIRCTLTHADLAARHLKLSELAYGTEKAKSLFRDMMQQASFDFGFEAEDLPLIITKVEDPEELDTRFSKFTQSMDSEASPTEQLEKLEGAEDFLNLLNKVKEAAADIKPASKPQEEPAPLNVRLFSFNHIDLVIQAAHLLAPAYHGSNTLYRDDEADMYILALTPSDHSANEFNKICNMLSEYGSLEKASASVLAFLEEHCEVVISSDAIQKLSQV